MLWVRYNAVFAWAMLLGCNPCLALISKNYESQDPRSRSKTCTSNLSKQSKWFRFWFSEGTWSKSGKVVPWPYIARKWTVSLLYFFAPIPCTYTCSPLDGMARNYFFLESWKPEVLHLHEGPDLGRTIDWKKEKRRERDERQRKKPSSQWDSNQGPLDL